MEDEKEKEKNIFQENVKFEKEIVWAFLCHIVHMNDSSSWDGKSEKERKKGRKSFEINEVNILNEVWEGSVSIPEVFDRF